MKVLQKKTIEIESIEDILCDRCEKSMKGTHGNINGVNVGGSGAYDSTHFPDGLSFDLDVCEECAAEWFKTFKHNPLNGEGTPGAEG